MLVFGLKRAPCGCGLIRHVLPPITFTIQDVQDALNRENVELPSGKIYGNQTEMTVKTFGRLDNEEDF